MNILFLLVILIIPSQAYAYLDPGLGSLLVQGFIAAIAVVTTAFGVYYRSIKSFLLKIKLRNIEKMPKKDENTIKKDQNKD